MMKYINLLLCACLTSCGIEKPPYESIKKEGNFEVRKYNSMRVVSAPMVNMDKRNTSFRKLFKYISGQNKDQQKISMTSPVLMDDKIDKKAGTMSFMIPANVAEKGAPTPSAEDLSIREIKGGTFATLKFSAWEKEESRKKAAEKLSALITENKLNSEGQPIFAIYDPPWIPELFRTNEIWLRLKD